MSADIIEKYLEKHKSQQFRISLKIEGQKNEYISSGLVHYDPGFRAGARDAVMEILGNFRSEVYGNRLHLSVYGISDAVLSSQTDSLMIMCKFMTSTTSCVRAILLLEPVRSFHIPTRKR